MASMYDGQTTQFVVWFEFSLPDHTGPNAQNHQPTATYDPLPLT